MALFTVEQIELIRRLRSSGITREQVLLAFTELERLDAEFGRSSSYGEQVQNHNMEFSFSSTSVVRSNCTSGISGSALNMPTSDMNGSNHQMPIKQNEYFHSMSVTQCSNTNFSSEVSATNVNGDCSVNSSNLPSRLETELVLPPTSENVPCTDSQTQNAYNSVNCSFYPLNVQSEELAELQELKKYI